MNRYFATLLVLSGIIVGMDGLGAISPTRERLPDLDQRKTTPRLAGVTSSEQRGAVEALCSRLPRAQVEFDAVSGAPKMVWAGDDFLSGPQGQGKAVSTASITGFAAEDPDRSTKAFLREHRRLFGHGPEILAGARVQREFVTAHSGLRTVVWQQQVDGIAVFEGLLISHTSSRGELVNLASGFVPDPVRAAGRGAADRVALETAPTFSAIKALSLAASNTGEQLDEAGIVVADPASAGPERLQKFTAPALKGEAEAKLVWLPMSRDELRLCWDVILMSRARGEMFRVLLDVQTGEVLLRRCLTENLSNASYRVFTSDSPSPLSPGYSTPNSSQPPLVSRTLVTLGALSTNASPNGWIDDGVNETRGNNVDAHTDWDANNVPDVPRPQGSPFRVFDFDLDLSQAPRSYSNAAVVQLFFWNNFMHDKLYDLGFTEAAGNFQNNNFGRGGLGNDAVQADAQDGGGTDNANFSPAPDGSPGRMQMYLFTGPTPNRDGDLDAEVVLHEYTHGLSSRLVGGGVGISAWQTRGMGEGWSDFYAMALLSEAGDDVNGVYAFAAYVSYLRSGAPQIATNLTQNYYFGIRRYPYCTDKAKNPLTFKDIDPNQAGNYLGIPLNPIIRIDATEVHNIGNVWCVTLWEARANLINKYGWAVGNQLILQLVTDGMNLSPANPSFLQARDAILQADRVDNGGLDLTELWAAFAKRGMGFSASSPTSDTLEGVSEAYNMPDDLFVAPMGLSASGPFGGPFTLNTAFYMLTNTGHNPLNWRLANTSSWFATASASGTLSPGGPAASVAVSVTAAANSFPPGVYSAVIWFTNQTDGVVQSSTFTLAVSAQHMFDYFDAGIDLSQWSSFGGVVGSTVLATNYGGCVSPPNSLWFGDNGRRYAATIPIDTTSGGTISFNLRLADGLAWPWALVDVPRFEGVEFEASTNNGSTWTLLSVYDTTSYYGWTAVATNIPVWAEAPATLFRWRQTGNDGSAFDHWALDNVVIDAGPTPPLIRSQPTGQTTYKGDTATFTTTASGTWPLSYQWSCNGWNIPGATGAVLTLTNVQSGQAGNYMVLVANAYGSVLSSNAMLTVSAPPPCVPAPAGLVSWWRAEGDAADAVGGITGTLNGNVTFGAGKVGRGFVFDGTTDAVQVGNPANLQLQDLTIEAWVKRASAWAVTGSSWGVGMIFAYGYNGYGLYLDAAGHPTMTKVGINNVSTSASITDTNLHHLVVTKNGSTVVFYVDGVGYPAPAYDPKFTFTTGAEIGADGANMENSFLGTIDEVSIYGRALSSTEVQSIYHAGKSGKCLGSIPPTIVSQPTDQTAVAGGTATFAIAPVGWQPLSYQWQFNGVNLAGAAGSTLTLTNVQTGAAGNYSVFVSNLAGTTNSAPAVLSIINPPVLRPVNLDASGAFSFLLTGGTGLDYLIEVSTDLESWTLLTTLSNVAAQVLVTDTNAVNSVEGFYRATLLR